MKSALAIEEAKKSAAKTRDKTNTRGSQANQQINKH